MRRLILILMAVLLFLFSTSVRAQTSNAEAPALEIYGGPSLLRNQLTEIDGHQLMGGWNASASWNFRKSIGITGDFGGEYRSISGTGVHQYTYLLGPRIAVRDEKATAFMHILFGGVTFGGGGGSTTGSGMGVGGGIDYKVSKNFTIRAIQFDSMPKRIQGNWFHDFRLGAGVVFKFGEPRI